MQHTHTKKTITVSSPLAFINKVKSNALTLTTTVRLDAANQNNLLASVSTYVC